MKLFAPILLGLTEAGDHRATVEMARDTFGNSSRVCGMMSGENGHMAETMMLDAGESCIYRIKPTRGAPEDSHLHIRLVEAAEVDCNEVQLHVVTDTGNGPEVMGPYCYETHEDGSRHRRGAYSSDTGMDYASKEVDMVYTRTDGGGFKFAFNFEFEFELLPGIPGAAMQDGYKEQMGSYGKPDHTHGKPAYGKPEKPAAYGGDNEKPKPAYNKPAKPAAYGGDNEKPKPAYNKPTQAPYKPKPTTAKPYKPTTEKPATEPYKPTTEKPYKPTTEKPYKPTTEKPTTEKPTTEKPYKPSPTPYKPQPTKPYGGGGKPVLYKPNAKCPWETNHGYSSYAGDCPGHENKCNLKYFRVCGESFFNKVYNDVCKWQDAKQLIPMFTEKLVPLGAQFEKKHGVKCNGLNKEGKSLQELFGAEPLPTSDSERDVAQCKPIAGAVPCDLINFHGVTHAREFHHKVEALYHEYLINHCNKEWQVHFEALLKRMRNSLFCDDGGHPDHDGYVVSPPPPTYGNKPKPPTEAPYKPPTTPKPTPYKPKPTSYKPKPPTTPKPTPYKPKPTSYKPKPPTTPKPTPYKPKPTSYKPKPPTTPKPTPYKPKPTSHKPKTPKTPKPTPYKPSPPKPTSYSGNNNTPKPYKPPSFKPNANCPWEQNGNYASYGGDCPGHNGLCNLKYFRVCGETFFNKVYNDVCHWQDAAQLIPMITKKLVPLGAQFEKKNSVKCNGLNKEQKSLQELFGGVVPDGERDVAECKPIAGAVPCKYIDFTGITSARQFHHRIVDLYQNFLKQHCNKEWQVHFEALLKRMQHSLFCDDGGMPDHDGYVVSPPPPVYKPTNPPPTPTQYKPKPPVTPKPPKPYAASKPGYPQKPPVEFPGQYTSYPGPLETQFYCPWNNGNYNDGTYSSDCPNGKCSLKFSGRCISNLFNKVYQNICAWQEAIKLVKDITGFLTELGIKWQKENSEACKDNVNAYQSGARSQYIPVDFTHDSDKYVTQTIPDDADVNDYRRRRATVREVPACKIRAGLIRCDKFNFHAAKNELEFYHMIKNLVESVSANGCNAEWTRRMNSFVQRLKNALTCEGGLQPDH